MKLSQLMRIVDEHKLTPSAMRLFFLVCEEYPVGVDQSQVAKYPPTLGMSASSIGRHLRKFEELGWLKRSLVDKKSFQIDLTHRGLTLWHQFSDYSVPEITHAHINDPA